MEAAIQTRGLLSLPSTPAGAIPRRISQPLLRFHPLHGLRVRLSPWPAAAGFPTPALRSLCVVQASHGFPEKQGNSMFSAPAPSERPLLSVGDGCIRDGFRRRERREGGKGPRQGRHHPPQAVPAAAEGGGLAEPRKFLGVHVSMLKKIVPLGLMFFCILFNYTILRDTKDMLVVTAKCSSAEIIPFLKTWVNLPMAIGFMLLCTKLSNVLSKEALFYTVIFPKDFYHNYLFSKGTSYN